MRKKLICLLVAVVIVLALGIPVWADAPTQPGFYLTDSVTGVSIKGVTADKTEIEAVHAKPSNSTVNDADQYHEFYPGSKQLKVTLSGTDSSLQYVVILSSGETITENTLKYIDQKGNGGSLTFYVYPDTLTANTQLTLWITNSGGGAPVKVSLGYWVETSYEEQPYVLGDVNTDTLITAYDASCILQHCTYGHVTNVSGNVALTSGQMLAANVNGDEAISPLDASLILQYLVRSQSYTNYSLADFVAAVTY